MANNSATIDIPQAPVTEKKGSIFSRSFESRKGFSGTDTYETTREYVGIQSGPPTQLVLIEPVSEDGAFFSRPRGAGKTRVTAIPKLEWLVKQDPVLTNKVRKLLATLYAIVISRALQVGIPLQRSTISVFEDTVEQERIAILRLTCNVNAPQALAFWDSLEPDLQTWLRTLGENDRTTYITRVGLRIHWQ